jgi:hypothetical protein
MSNLNIPCLSLRDPWCWCVTDLEKGIENRKVNTHFRGTFAIQLSTGCTPKEELAILDQIRSFGFDPKGWPGRKSRPRGCVVALATLIDVVPPHTADGDELILRANQDPRWWFKDQFGYILGRIVKLPEPLPCIGALGFFSLTNLVGPFEYPRMNPRNYATLVRFAKDHGLAA